MKKHSKHFAYLKSLVNPKEYSMDEGIKLITIFSSQVNFVQSIEAHFNINVKQKNQKVQTFISLPHEFGTKKAVALFTKNQSLSLSDKVTQNIALKDPTEILTQIKTNKIQFDVLFTTPDLMKELTPYGKILGPRGLMPSYKNATLGEHLDRLILEYLQGKIDIKADKYNNIHLVFGKTTFVYSDLLENFQKVTSSLQKYLITSLPGTKIKSLYICTSMSPSIKINLNTI